MENTLKRYKKIKNIPMRFIPQMVLAFFSINILSLAMPLTMKKIYGSIIGSGSVEALRYILGLALIAMLLEAIMRKFKESSSKWIAAKYEFQLSNYLIEKLLSSYSDEHNSNYISNIEKFKSISKLTNFHSTAFYQLLIDLPFTAIFLYLIYLYGGELVWIPITISLLYIVIVYLISVLYFKSQSDYVNSNDQLMGQLIETLEKIHLIKSAGIEESQINKYKLLLDHVSQSEFSSNKYKILPAILGSKFSQLTLFLILISGGYLVSADAITFGQITACAMLGGRAVSPVIKLMKFYLQTQDIKIIGKRIDELASLEEQYAPDIPNFPSDIYGAIELIDLAYNDIHHNVKKTISINIAPGDFLVIDPTDFPSYRRLINKIMGYDPVDGGKILIDNLDVDEWNMNSLKGKIESLNEHVSIFKGSVLENITYFNPKEIQNAFEASKLTGLHEIVSAMPEGFSTEIDSQMTNYLSSAFLQRLNLTRALLERPRIMIFDRIDENMDKETLELFMWLLEKFKGKSTIIIATWHEGILSMGDYSLKDMNEKTI